METIDVCLLAGLSALVIKVNFRLSAGELAIRSLTSGDNPRKLLVCNSVAARHGIKAGNRAIRLVDEVPRSEGYPLREQNISRRVVF